MPSMSEIIFDAAGLTPFGREPDFVAPKPPSPRKIAKLANDLERLEWLRDNMWEDDRYRKWRRARMDVLELRDHTEADLEALDPCFYSEEIQRRLHVAHLAYSDALAARNLFEKVKAEQSKRMPRYEQVDALSRRAAHAEHHFDIIEKCRPDFASLREFVEAHAAHCLANDLYEIALRKFRSAARMARLAGKPFRDRPRRHVITNGYVTTGQYKMINGVRVPVVETIA
jgi:hypothetical protein